MEKINKLIGLVFCLSGLLLGPVHAEMTERIDSAKAPFYVGKTVMVCGVIKEVVPRTKNVYLNMTRNYPREDLALVVWKEDFGLFREKFGSFENLSEKRVCALGELQLYKQHIQMPLSNPKNLRLMKK